jgi:hypothetical protein
MLMSLLYVQVCVIIINLHILYMSLLYDATTHSMNSVLDLQCCSYIILCCNVQYRQQCVLTLSITVYQTV